MRRLFITIAALFVAGFAQAQTAPVLNFSPQTAVGAGSVVPVLTWSTTPAANSCTASGDPAWTGTKAASGTQTLAAITTSKTYNLQCTWSTGESVRLTWSPATTNTDGSPYTDAKNVKVYFGTNAATLSTPSGSSPVVLGPTATSTTIGPLAPGTWHFGATSVNMLDIESAMSTTVSKAISATNVTRSVGITVNPKPLPPSNFAVE